jgi:hypothetical protein
MKVRGLVAVTVATMLLGGAILPVAAQSVDQPIELVVKAGRPLRVSLDERVTVRRIGQAIAGTIVEPVYAYDRIVVPAGTLVRGHVEAFENASRGARVRAMAAGNFTPLRRAVLQFDTLVFGDGREIPIHTVVNGGVERMRRRVAGGSMNTGGGAEKTGLAARARDEIAQKAAEMRQRANDALAAVKAPGKMERLKDAAIRRLPYYPPFLSKGTVYDAELVSPVSFGMATPLVRAPAGSAPAPESILSGRLITTLDSAKTPRGTAIEAVVTEPVFSADHQLILPEGTVLTGEVTFTRQARRFRRNGQLRFLFDTVHAPEQEPHTMLASLYAVQSGDDGLALDDEGGATITNSKRRFVTPALAVLALHASAGHHQHHGGAVGQDAGAPIGTTPVASGGVGSRGLGGFFGFGLIGVGLSQFSKPVAVAFGMVGVGRTTYSSLFGKGQEVSFPAATVIQLQLAPGPTAAR